MSGKGIPPLMPDGTIKAALSMVCCGLPAAKKTSGFVSFSANSECHRCKRQFIQINEPKYSGTNYDVWHHRTKEENDQEAEKWHHAETRYKTARSDLESDNGTRWSELHRLPYFDAPSFTVIEQMHNLYLGTVKKLVNIWLNDATRSGFLNVFIFFTRLMKSSSSSRRCRVMMVFPTMHEQLDITTAEVQE